MNIDWNKYFDHIYIISRCKNFDRRQKLDEQLSKICLTNYKYWYVPDYEFTNSKLFLSNDYLTDSNKRCTMGHYSLWKITYELNYDNILIIEDDAAFLKDLSKIIEVLDEFEKNKSNSDIYMFDYAHYDDVEQIISYLLTTIYYVNRTGLEYLISMHETYNIAADNYFIDFYKMKDYDDDFIIYYSVYPGKCTIDLLITKDKGKMNLKVSKTHLAIQQDKPYQNVDKSLYYT